MSVEAGETTALAVVVGILAHCAVASSNVLFSDFNRTGVQRRRYALTSPIPEFGFQSNILLLQLNAHPYVMGPICAVLCLSEAAGDVSNVHLCLCQDTDTCNPDKNHSGQSIVCTVLISCIRITTQPDKLAAQTQVRISENCLDIRVSGFVSFVGCW